MTKRIITLILTIAMVMLASACAGNDDRSPEFAENSSGTGAFFNEDANVDKSGDDRNSGEPAERDTGITEEEPADQAGIDSGEPAEQTDAASGNLTDTDVSEEEPADQFGISSVKPAEQDTGITEEVPADQAGINSGEPSDQGNGITNGHTVDEAGVDGESEPIKDETDTLPKTEALPKPEDPAGKEDESKVLEGRIICIDPGHQTRGNYDTEPVAPDSDEMKAKVSSGTAGVKTRIPEYKLVLEVALKLRDALEKHGATVVMTRTENNVDISNAERAAIANDANADLYFRVHADGSTDKSIHGVSVLIPGDKYITDEYVLKESEKAGSFILDGFVKTTGAKRRGLVKRNDLSGFNWCRVPMALIEIGFMSNAQEDAKLNTSEYQDKMVEGMVEGMLGYFAKMS